MANVLCIKQTRELLDAQVPEVKLCSQPGRNGAEGKVRMLQHPEHREVCSPSERLCGTKARCPGSTDPVTVIKALGE